MGFAHISKERIFIKITTTLELKSNNSTDKYYDISMSGILQAFLKFDIAFFIRMIGIIK